LLEAGWLGGLAELADRPVGNGSYHHDRRDNSSQKTGD
jgi:hypothetical protein